MRLNAAVPFISMLTILSGCGSKPANSASPSATTTPDPTPTEPATAAVTATPTSTAEAASTGVATSAVTAQASDACVPAGKDLTPCVGKASKLTGTKPQHVTQHPIAAAPFPDANGKVWKDEVFEVGGVQIVVLVEKPSACAGQAEIVGNLRAVSGGGAPGTKGRYQGFVVDRATVRCL